MKLIVNPYVNSGCMPNHYTEFGRHYKLFDSLQEELGRSKSGHKECIVIGPGADGPSDSITTYQPYELANSLIHAGVKDYRIEVVDLNLEVLKTMKTQPPLMMLTDAARFEGGLAMKGDDKTKWSRYFYRFFWDDEIEGEWPFGKTVMIPQDVNSRFVLRQGDVINGDFGKEKYDVLVCTVVLSYYTPEVADRYLGIGEYTIDQTEEVMKKLGDSVKPGGYMITSESSYWLNDDWKTIENHDNVSAGVHETSAALLRKK